VIALHGGGGTAAGNIGFTNFDALADREGFVVAYPQGIRRHWNDGAVPGQADDVGFISALIDTLAESDGIDRTRVYATGISNGAIMSFHLACAIPNKIAAIASVAGSMPAADAERCANGPVMPVLMLHGTADPLVPYGGGHVGFAGFPSRDVLPVESTVAFFATRGGCKGGKATTKLFPDVDRVAAQGCPPAAAVELYRIAGGGHTWPGGRQYLPERFIGPTNREIDATKTIWSFFARFRRE
jgi:polyhydroxybutyrate depolymerase